MRILTDNSLHCISYSDYLASGAADVLFPAAEKNKISSIGKEYSKFQLSGVLSSFLKEVLHIQDDDEIRKSFCDAVGKIIIAQEYQLFLCDEYNRSLLPGSSDKKSSLHSYLNNNFQSGGLNEIFENLMPAFYEGSEFFNDFRKKNYALIPLHDSGLLKGVLFLRAPEFISFHDQETQKAIQILFSAFLLKSESYKQKELLKSLFYEIQSYQTKLLKDYRYSAIGEFTAGIIEEIFSGLQIILSSADMKVTTAEGAESESILLIKKQVERINTLLTNLAKFASRTEHIAEKKPVNIGQIIKEYCSFASASLRNKNYEIILEQDDSIPTILSNADQIKQILTSIFRLMVKDDNQQGGVFVHTRYINNYIIVRFLSTDHFGELLSDENESINIKIIKKIMDEHNGMVVVRTKGISGSSITLHFPVFRQVKK